MKLDNAKELKKLLVEKRGELENELKAVFNNDLTEIRLTGKSKFFGSHEYREKIKSVKNIFDEIKEDKIGLEIKPQGYLPLYVKMTDFITTSQVSSFLMAFLCAGVLLLICFKNIKIVLLSILPNLIPIAFVIILNYFRFCAFAKNMLRKVEEVERVENSTLSTSSTKKSDLHKTYCGQV